MSQHTASISTLPMTISCMMVTIDQSVSSTSTQSKYLLLTILGSLLSSALKVEVTLVRGEEGGRVVLTVGFTGLRYTLLKGSNYCPCLLFILPVKLRNISEWYYCNRFWPDMPPCPHYCPAPHHLLCALPTLTLTNHSARFSASSNQRHHLQERPGLSPPNFASQICLSHDKLARERVTSRFKQLVNDYWYISIPVDVSTTFVKYGVIFITLKFGVDLYFNISWSV